MATITRDRVVFFLIAAIAIVIFLISFKFYLSITPQHLVVALLDTLRQQQNTTTTSTILAPPDHRHQTSVTKPSSSEETKMCDFGDNVVCEMVKANETTKLWEFVRWELSAPSAMTCKNRRRIGKDVGALDQEPYSICFDPLYAPVNNSSKKCLVYSFGIANEWDFDDAMASSYKCEVLSFDPSMGLAEEFRRESGAVFYKIGLSPLDTVYSGNPEKTKEALRWRHYGNANPHNWTMLTLRSVAKHFKHENKIIDILKLDIEGAEVPSLMQALEDGFLQSNVVTLTLEWHLWNGLVGDNIGLLNLLASHRKLAECGFVKFHVATRTVQDGFFPLESYVNKQLAIKLWGQ